MSQTTATLLGIKKAALLIAYDNGLINREESENLFLDRVDSILGADGVYLEDLKKIDMFLLSLSDEDIDTLCCGLHEDSEPIVQKFEGDQEKLVGLLNDIFE